MKCIHLKLEFQLILLMLDQVFRVAKDETQTIHILICKDF